MCIEIEAKLKVDSLGEIRDRLSGAGAKFLEEQVQTDSYFDDADGTLTKSDKCLRLRCQRVGGDEKIILTYKGAKEKDDFKKRQELEFEIVENDSAEKLLFALGYEKISSVKKVRQTWRLGECEVALDELDILGSFVEIEGADDEQITKVQTALGLSALPHIQQSYAYLLQQKMTEAGSP